MNSSEPIGGTTPLISRVSLPAIFAFPSNSSLVLKGPSTARQSAILGIQSILLRLLTAVPPGKLRFTFIDPVGLGQSAAPFMHLADYDEQLITGKAWSNQQHIEQRLVDLTEHMENVIQKYLRNQYRTIEDYNTQAGEVAEAYRVLVVFDFPANFSEAAARRLVSIAQNGPRCGVYALVLADPEKVQATSQSYGGLVNLSAIQLALSDLEQTATVIAWTDGCWVWQDADYRSCALELDTPPDADVFNRIIMVVGEAAKDASRVEVPFERIVPSRDVWWTEDSRDGLRAALGPSGARKIQFLELGEGTAQHALIAGKTGSGKSNLLHALINSLAISYSPSEVQLYLIDFKKGVEFKPYAVNTLPHARVIAIESEREFGLSVLQGLDAELKRRGDLFRRVGVDGIADYRAKSGQAMPRILLLVDEFQEFFTVDDNMATQASQMLDRLVRQGRAFGIHVLLGSQTLAGASRLARSTMDQMAVRIALQSSEADSRLILAEDNPAARLLNRPGEAIYNAANGTVEGNTRFQVVWLPDEQRDLHLALIDEMARERGYVSSEPQIVFEGNAPAEAEKNAPLINLLANPSQPAPARRVSAWLGDPVAIRNPVAAYFRRQSASNLLILGQQDDQAVGMIAMALLSLFAQHSVTGSGSARFYVLDFTSTDAPYAGLLAHLTETTPHVTWHGARRQLSAMIDELASEVVRRLSSDDGNLTTEPSLYLVLPGLQRARDLRPADYTGPRWSHESEDLPASPSSSEQFAAIVRDGPEVGVHTLLWCDTYSNLMRTIDRRLLREFDQRVAFQMSAEDSANLLDTPAASRLGPYRALFYSEEEGRIEKFRPYGLPSEEWLAWASSQLRKMHG